jgi:hypothetical protein
MPERGDSAPRLQLRFRGDLVLLVGFQKRWDVCWRNAQGPEILSRIRAAVTSRDLPVCAGPMENNRQSVFIRVGSAERPIARNGDVQDLPELFREELSHLLNILRIAKIPSNGRHNQTEKCNSGSQDNGSA